MNIRKAREEQNSLIAGVATKIEDSEATVLIASARNPEFTKKLRVEERKFRRRKNYKNKRDLKPEETAEIMVEAMYETVVKGWDGIFDGDTPLEFGYENYKALMDPEDGVWKFREHVFTHSADLEEILEEEAEDLEGN